MSTIHAWMIDANTFKAFKIYNFTAKLKYFILNHLI